MLEVEIGGLMSSLSVSLVAELTDEGNLVL